MLRRLAILALALGGAASAAPSLDSAARRQLDRTQTEARTAATRHARFGTEAEAALGRAERAGRALVRLAARIQAAERDLTAVERRLAVYERQRRAVRARLAARQEETTALLATLQTLSRRPAALAFVQPATTADVAHVRMALDAMTPDLRARTAALRADVAEAERTVARLTAEQRRQAEARSRLAAERMQLARIEVTQRRAGGRLSAAAEAEARRAETLGATARSLRDLVARLGPAAFAAPAAIRLLPPVAGELRERFGNENELGLHLQGVTLSARSGAQVVAPAAGRVAFAGSFRTYGRIVIIEHGGGWLSLMAGLAATTVRAGEIVPEGMPLGRMGTDAAPLYLELRALGVPVDPLPYLARPKAG